MSSSESLKISIVTVVYNGEATIEDAILSVAGQSYSNIEHIIIDGGSTDDTMAVINKYRKHIHRVVSEPDRGIYDAMNKGIRYATGDIIGILNADDMYVDSQSLSKIAEAFEQNKVDAVLSDLFFVSPHDLNTPVRIYRAKGFTHREFALGNMPPHPATFITRKCYNTFGLYKIDYKIAADFELLARFIRKKKISCHYLPKFTVKMRTGGVSTRGLRSNLLLNREVYRACKENSISTNLVKIYSKYFFKVKQLWA